MRHLPSFIISGPFEIKNKRFPGQQRIYVHDAAKGRSLQNVLCCGRVSSYPGNL